MSKLTHINDVNWISDREKRWEICLKYTITKSEHTKTEIKLYKEFFFTGNFENFLKKYESKYPQGFMSLLELYPAERLDDLLCFTQQYWQWCIDTTHVHQEYFLSNASEIIYSSFRNIYEAGRHTPVNVKKDVFLWLHGKVYEKRRLLDIGVEELDIQIEINPVKLSSDLHSAFWTLLFYKPQIVDKQILINDYFYFELSGYYFSICHFLRSESLALNFNLNRREKNSFGYRIQAGQKIFREYLLLLLGFEIEGTVRNYPEHEKEIKQKLFDEIKMPDDFYTLVEYLNKAGLAALEVPE